MWVFVKKFFTSFCTESSVHGVKYLIKDKNSISRCYWCFMLVFAIYCCSQFSLLLSRRFLEIPIRMTIKNNQARTEKLRLPSITFCSENATTDTWYERFLDNVTLPPNMTRESVLEAMRYTVSEVTPRYEESPKSLNVTLLAMLDHVLEFNDIQPRDFMEQVSVPCDVLLSRCQLRGEVMPCGDIFRRVRGQCCLFTDDAEEYHRPGKVFSNNLMVVSSLKHGDTYFSVHNADSEPLIGESHFTMNNGYYILFYTDPFLVLKSEEVHEVEEDSGVCVHPDEQFLRFFDEYDFAKCVTEWSMNFSLAVCGCVATYYPGPDEYTCSFTQMNCLRENPRKYFDYLQSIMYCKKPAVERRRKIREGRKQHDVICYKIVCTDDLKTKKHSELASEGELGRVARSKGIEIQNDCPNACENLFYRFNFKPRALVPSYECTGFLTSVDPKNEFVVQFNYQSQFYTVQEFVLIADWITLLSNLGGVYGLFLGCSMVTLAELIYFLWSTVVSQSGDDNRVRSDQTSF